MLHFCIFILRNDFRSINSRTRAFRSRFDASRASRCRLSIRRVLYTRTAMRKKAGRFRMQNATAARVSTQISRHGYPEGSVALWGSFHSERGSCPFPYLYSWKLCARASLDWRVIKFRLSLFKKDVESTFSLSLLPSLADISRSCEVYFC